MKRSILQLLPLCLALICSSCNQAKDNFDVALLETEDVCLKVSGKDVFVYDPLTCQLSSGSDAKTFRAFKDDASDYFTLTLSSAPAEKDQVISGCTVTWTTETDLVCKKALTFKVRKIDDGGFVWLWCSSAKIFALVRIL